MSVYHWLTNNAAKTQSSDADSDTTGNREWQRVGSLDTVGNVNQTTSNGYSSESFRTTIPTSEENNSKDFFDIFKTVGGREFVLGLTPVRHDIEDRVRGNAGRLLARRAISVVDSRKRRAIVHHGTYRSDNVNKLQEVLNGVILKANSSKQCFVSIYYHAKGGHHLHAIHDCPFSNGTCRCFDGIIFQRKTTKRDKFGRESEELLRNAIYYNFEKWRCLLYNKIGHCTYRPGISFNDVVVECSGRYREENPESGLVEIPEGADEILWYSFGGRDPTSTDNSGIRESPGNSNNRRYKRDETKAHRTNLIEKQIFKIGAAPTKEFCNTSIWHESDLKHIDPQSPEVKIALERVIFKLSNYSLYDFKTYYKTIIEDPEKSYNKFTWSAYDKNKFGKVYIQINESYKILKRLLIWQFAPEHMDNNFKVFSFNWKDKVFKWVKYFMHFIDGESGKKNCLYVLSPPNSGKTLFFDTIFDYLLNVGNMKHWNRAHSFPIEELAGCKIAMWNEPSYESSVEPELLKLLGGDRISVNQKYKSARQMRQIPIIVTSNEKKFPDTEAFNVRINYEYWKPAPFLEPIGKLRLHPLAFDLLFNDCENYLEEEIRMNNHLKYTTT